MTWVLHRSENLKKLWDQNVMRLVWERTGKEREGRARAAGHYSSDKENTCWGTGKETSTPFIFTKNQSCYGIRSHSFVAPICNYLLLWLSFLHSQETHLKVRLIRSFWPASWLVLTTRACPTWVLTTRACPKMPLPIPTGMPKSFGLAECSQTSTIWSHLSLFLLHQHTT